MNKKKIAILGGGNIGKAIAFGLLKSGNWNPSDIFVTKRKPEQLNDLKDKGIKTGSNNEDAIRVSDIILLAVRPKQLTRLITEIKDTINQGKHVVGSVITAFSISDIEKEFGFELPLVRIMPNTAIAIGESMTCLACKEGDEKELDIIKEVFDQLGSTLVIEESLMSAATILGACGIAYFLRSIRAASQGGIQVGFHAEEAQLIASQTARGAASLLLHTGHHPEDEIDKVTTPRGCTIAGLNEMEHNGLSSAFIKGIVKSYEQIEYLK